MEDRVALAFGQSQTELKALDMRCDRIGDRSRLIEPKLLDGHRLTADQPL